MKRKSTTQELHNALCQPVIQQHQLDRILQFRIPSSRAMPNFARVGIIIAIMIGIYMFLASTIEVPA